MSLLDTISTQIAGALSAGSKTGEGAGVMDVIGGLINNPETGGLQGLISTFEEKGLGGLMASWIGTGKNLPISAEQIQSALGNEQVQAIAQKLGISSGETAGQLANLLPQVIDKLTPTGAVPEGGGALEKALTLLKGFGEKS